MIWYDVAGVIACVLAAGVALAVATIVRVRRPFGGRNALALMMLAVAEWTLLRALEGAAVDLAAKVLWAKLEYVGIAAVTPLWLHFALAYGRHATALRLRTVVLLWAIPVVTAVLALTNEHHRLVWTSVVPSTAHPNVLLYGHGAWFWVAAAYAYVLMLAGTVALVMAIVRLPASYRFQTAALLVGAALPWGANLAYLTGHSPIPGLDLTPFGFTLGGLIIATGVLRFRLFDLVPVARDVLVERMSDGVLVVDAHERIVDINPAAQRHLGLTGTSPIGRPVAEVLAGWPEREAWLRNPHGARGELTLGEAGALHHFDVLVLPLHDRRHGPSGRLVSLRDVTERRQAERELRVANDRLKAQLAEIEALHVKLSEQATRDWLTGLFNRRFFEDTLDRELSRAVRDKQPLALVLMDVDQLKELNDGAGHRVGDLVLATVGQLLAAQTRRGDLACRFGGDEFVVIMPGATLETAAHRAEQWREALEALEVSHAGQSHRSTISLGVAAFPGHGSTSDEILRAADEALYAAKAAGRNRVTVAGTARAPEGAH